MASEEERGQTGRLRRAGVEGHQREAEGEQKSVGKRRPERVTAPYAKLEVDRWYQSTAGHEESRGKPGGPPPKPKYYLMTDSEKYSDGKLKRTPEGE